MKRSFALGIILAAFSSAAMAETPSANSTQTETSTGGGNMSKHIRSRMDERMEQMWKEMDANGDGSISREESTAFGNKKFDEKDTDHDGKVTREEWDAFRDARMKKMKDKKNMEHGDKNMGDKKHAPSAPADSKK